MSRPRSDVKERFLSKVQVVDSGCHEWLSVLNRGGYGKFYYEGKQEPAHRVAYMLFKGEIPKGEWILHKCDNRKCVNPEHLFLGDCKANIKDMDEKGRRGTKSKLTYAQVDEINKLLDERFSQQYVADKFGVDQTTISKIRLGITKMFKI